MLYSEKLQDRGWRDVHIDRIGKLLWCHAIRAEEMYGLSICTENLEYSVHIADDIRRHSSLDNYSCELYERAILRHKAQKHNSKGLEKTFAVRESIRNFLEDYEQVNGPISEYGAGRQLYRFNVADAVIPYYFNELPFKSCKLLLKSLSDNPQPYIQHALSFGVAVGRVKRKIFPASIANDLTRFFNRQGIDVRIPRSLLCAKSIALIDDLGNVEKFTKGTTCKILSEDNTTEWIMEISTILIVGPADGYYYTFVNGPYYIPTIDGRNNVITHQWTKTVQLISRDYVLDSVQPANRIKRKVMLYPEPSNLHHPRFSLCIDFKNPNLTSDVDVPIYPKVLETIRILGPGNQLWHAKVVSVDVDSRKATVQWYDHATRPGLWALTRNEDVISFLSIVGLCTVNRVVGGYQIH